MDLQHYLAILWRRKWIILITVFITEIVVIIGTLKAQPIYSALTTLRIASASSGSVSYYDYMYADRLMNTYVKLATTIPVLDELKQRLKLSNLPPIEVKPIPDTELIQITVEHTNPLLAANVANTLADVLINQSLELYTGSGKSSQEILSEQVSQMEEEVNQARTEYMDLVAKDPGDTESIQAAKQKLDLEQELYAAILEQYEQSRLKEAVRAKSVSVVEPAIPPDKPSKPRKELNIALGFLAGMVGGLGLTFLFENLDSTLFTADQIEAVTKLTSIGKIPQLENHNSIINLNGDFASGESFRRLRTNILLLENPVRTLLITSAEPGEGKSTIVANLAYSMAQSGRKVVVVDCDLRVPTQHTIFNIDNKVGLSSILEQKVTFTEAVQASEFQGLQILPSGPLPTKPAELLGSDQMIKLIKQLSHTFDLVIIDAPAMLAVADAIVIASMVDAVALVICRAMTSSGAVRALQAQLSKVKARLIGVIINRAELNKSHYYYDRKEASLNK